MKIYSLLMLCLLLVFSSNAQIQKLRTLYYNNEWVVTTKDSAKYYRTCLMDTAKGLFDGEVLDYTKDGKLVMKGTYKLVSEPRKVLVEKIIPIEYLKKESLKEGVFSSYFPSGQIESQGEFKNNYRSGVWKYYYPSGQPRYEVEFKDSLNFFVVASYDANGEQLINDGTGDWQYVYSIFNKKGRVIIQGHFVEGKKIGEWICRYSSGEAVYIERYTNDNFESGKYAGADVSEEIIFKEKFANKFPLHFKYETTENFLYRNFLTRLDYPFLTFLKKHPSQITHADSAADRNKVFLVVERPPEFEGGNVAMHKFVEKNREYPSSARKMQIEGTVYVGFVIDTDGSVSDIKIIKGISKDCDDEAIRVISIMPKWRPGMQSGKAVRVKFVYPIKFKRGR